jgi:RNA polymerase sigma-70 factor (ECF subfamily)
MTNRHAQQLIQHIPRLRRYARALLKDTERAEDLLQETLARALGKLNFWRRGSDMRAWLFSIMHNQYVNDCRRAQRRPDSLPLQEERAQEPRANVRAEQRAHLRDYVPPAPRARTSARLVE